MHFVASPTLFQFICPCLWVCLSAPACARRCRRVYKHMHLCMCPCKQSQLFWAEQKTMIAFSPWCCLTLLFCALYAISCYLETQLSIISIIAGKLQSAFDLLLIFFLLVTLKWVEIQRSRNYRMTWAFFLLLFLCVSVHVWWWSVILAMDDSWRVSRNVFSSSWNGNIVHLPLSLIYK